MKKAKNLISLLLISLLVFSTIQLISGNFVSASTGAANFLPNNFQWVDTQNEVQLSRSVAQYITSALASYNYPNGCYYSYDDDCTVSRYTSILSTLQTYYDQSIVFSKGHRDAQGDPLHIGLIDNDGNTLWDNWIADPYFDDELYPLTSTENAFTFIWHCQTQNWYPDGATPDGNGDYHGMPYCWTHNPDLGYYGYQDSGNQVFLGWSDNTPDPPYPLDGGSPQYEWAINANYNYANVAGTFWYYMCNGYSTAQALINLSYIIYGTSFEYTDLAMWLVVWGNVYLGLP
jgi:hypothetical protein